ncbi:MAG: 3-keto-5-aminohexanoate cleavage protein [Hyphomicrobiaceae bacterium]
MLILSTVCENWLASAAARTPLGGHPGTLKGLQAHLDFLPPDRRIVWTVVNYGGNLLALAGTIIALGGHISIGMGDYSYPKLRAPTDAQLIERVVQIAGDVGREVATPDEAEQILAIQ